MISPVAESRPQVYAGRRGRRIFDRWAGTGVLPAVFLLILSLAAAVPDLSGAEPDGRYAILLTGASGDPDLQKMYLEEIQKLHSILVGPLSFPRDHVIVLFDDPEKNPELIRYKSTRRGLEEACLEPPSARTTPRTRTT